MRDTLARYRSRRDFNATAEPRGEHRSSRGQAGADGLFVVQIHDARTMHFDFRLEADGVLKSWALPKGPSTDPRDKRLAVRTEDHPFEYRTFEGVIPEGEYGAGTVIVWDQGTYRDLSTDRSGRQIPLSEALENGHASFELHGRKMRGGYALTRMRTRGEGEREDWLLVKRNDPHAKAGQTPDPRRARSARTGRTLHQTAANATGARNSGS